MIKEIRNLKCGSNDLSLRRISAGLQKECIPQIVDNNKIIYSFDRTGIKTYIKTEGLSNIDLSKVVQIGLNLIEKDLDIKEDEIYQLLERLNKSKDLFMNMDISKTNHVNLVSPDGSSTEVTDCKIETDSPKTLDLQTKLRRSSMTRFTDEKMCITVRRNFNLICHLTQADLCFLKDFPQFVRYLSLVNGCLVSLGNSKIVCHGHAITVRDTLLLAPGGKKALSAIGSMYGEHLRKITLSASEYQNMDVLLETNPTLFKEYALRDSLISLVHACVLEDANFKVKKCGIPVSLSSLGSSNLRMQWAAAGYKGYQINNDYLIGDSSKLPTPRGLFRLGKVGLSINNYISNYKGGRNESFMIGNDTTTQ